MRTRAMPTDIRWRIYRREPHMASEYLRTVNALDRGQALGIAHSAYPGDLVDVIAEVTWQSLTPMEREVFLGTFVTPADLALAAIEAQKKKRMGRYVALAQLQRVALAGHA